MEGFARTKTEFEAKVTDVEARLEEVAAACEAKVNNAIRLAEQRLAEQMSAEVDAKIAKLEERVTAALEEKFNDALMKSEDIIARVKNLEVTVEDSAASAKELAGSDLVRWRQCQQSSWLNSWDHFGSTSGLLGNLWSNMSTYKTLAEELGRTSSRWLVTGAAGFIGYHLSEKLL